MERRYLKTELRTVNDDEGKMIVEGYAARFNVPSEPMGWDGSIREYIAPGAFRDSISQDDQYIHWNHNTDIVLGSTKSGTLTLSEDNNGLKMRAELPDTSWGKDTYELVKRGDVSQMSFGFQARKQEWDETDAKNIKRTLVDVRLFEVSIVPYPAYTQTNVEARTIDEALLEYRAVTGQPVTSAEEENPDSIKPTDTLIDQDYLNNLKLKIKLGGN